MLITYFYDSNDVLVRPLQSRKVFELVKTRKNTHECLGARGKKPNHQILDNETYSALKEHLKSVKVTFQLVTPYVHRRNEAERAMHNFKNHFMSI